VGVGLHILAHCWKPPPLRAAVLPLLHRPKRRSNRGQTPGQTFQALCFDCEEDMLEALAKDPSKFKGTVVVIRYEGPKVRAGGQTRSNAVKPGQPLSNAERISAPAASPAS
jgi:hypothetical protein